MSDTYNLIAQIFDKNSIKMSSKQIEQFKIYLDFLLEYNEKVNLTAITDVEGVIEMHFVDSLKGLEQAELIPNALCADIGTGAGFPGVPLAIARPDITVALVDSLNKRLVFLNELKEKLNIKNVYTVHGRSEDLGTDPKMRQKFDCVFSRAVARMNILCEYDLPFVKEGGYMLAWKGPAVYDELAEAENAIKKLGGEVKGVFTASFEDRQHFIAKIKKVASTPKQYPRQAGMPKKKPLV